MKLFWIGLILPFLGHSQSNPIRLKLMVDVPVQFGVGYETSSAGRLTGDFSFGLLTKPNSTIILNVMEGFGVDPAVKLMIEDAFESGMVFKTGLNYQMGKGYLGVHLQHLFLKGEETSRENVEEVMGEDLSSYPRYNRRSTQNVVDVSLKSYLLQVGLSYGYRISVNEQFEIIPQISFSANIYSQSSVSSDIRDYATLSESVDDYLKDIYHTYAFLPALSVHLVRRL